MGKGGYHDDFKRKKPRKHAVNMFPGLWWSVAGKLRRPDLHRRSQGYGPCELLLLHSAVLSGEEVLSGNRLALLVGFFGHAKSIDHACVDLGGDGNRAVQVVVFCQGSGQPIPELLTSAFDGLLVCFGSVNSWTHRSSGLPMGTKKAACIDSLDWNRKQL